MTFTHLPLLTPRTLTIPLCLIIGLIACLHAQPSAALEAAKNEQKKLTQCEVRLCDVILNKKPKKGVMACNIGKTWGKATLKGGAKQKDIDWSFGDARCNVELRIANSEIIYALTVPKFELNVWPHTVNCDVETGNGIKPVRLKLAPKIKFKNGKATKIRLKLKKVDGPAFLSSFIWTTAKLGFGLVHNDAVKEVNKFVHKRCAKKYAGSKKK